MVRTISTLACAGIRLPVHGERTDFRSGGEQDSMSMWPRSVRAAEGCYQDRGGKQHCQMPRRTEPGTQDRTRRTDHTEPDAQGMSDTTSYTGQSTGPATVPVSPRRKIHTAVLPGFRVSETRQGTPSRTGRSRGAEVSGKVIPGKSPYGQGPDAEAHEGAARAGIQTRRSWRPAVANQAD